MNEIWKDIDGYIGLYQVSNLGRVKSMNYGRTGNERVLKNEYIKNYLRVKLCKNGKSKRYLVHRLVAQAFIPNPDNLPCIDHIDTNPLINTYSNLRWCTQKENCNNPITKEKMSKCRKGELHPMYGRRGELAPMYGRRGELHPNYKKYGKLNPNSKPIIQLSINGEFIKKWDSSMDIQRELGFSRGNISECCNGKRNTAYGFKWRFAS